MNNKVKKALGFLAIDDSTNPILSNELVGIIGPLPYKILSHIAEFALTQKDSSVVKYLVIGENDYYKKIYRELIVCFLAGISQGRYYNKELTDEEMAAIRNVSESLKQMPFSFEALDSYNDISDADFIDTDLLLIHFSEVPVDEITEIAKDLRRRTNNASSGCTTIISFERTAFINNDFKLEIPMLHLHRSFSCLCTSQYPETIEELIESSLNFLLIEEGTGIVVTFIETKEGYIRETLEAGPPDEDEDFI